MAARRLTSGSRWKISVAITALQNLLALPPNVALGGYGK